MKKTIYFFLLITINVLGQESNNTILEKTILQLNKIERILYQSTFQAMENGIVYSERTDSIFFDFTNQNKNSTPKYFIKNDLVEMVFDGKQLIQSLAKEKLIVTYQNSNVNNPLMLMLFPIKRILPKMMYNSNIEIIRKKDTVVNGQEHYLFDLRHKNEILDWDRLALKELMGATNNYTLIIGKSDYLPRKIVMSNGPSGTMSRTFEDFNYEYVVDHNIWTGELFPAEYDKITFEEYFKIMQEKMASHISNSNGSVKSKHFENWELPNLEDNSMVDFSKLKGNVILLEFWFKNCGPCVQAVPKLNAIHEKYKDRKFQLFGIEYREDFPQENLMAYVEKIKIAYPTLYKGGSLAATYKVTAAPTFMIIDKKGDVIYAEIGFNDEEIMKVIEANL
jgi:thiol-disulfide isomerase/thioredoxin